VDLPSFLRQYSLAVFASTWEIFPYEQLVCMWAGMACVCASGGGAKELGESGRSLLLSPRRPAAIARRVAGLLKYPEFRAQIGRSAKIHARQKFSGHRIADLMFAVYASALTASQATKARRASDALDDLD
jgi:glycosyltransferase involved in cell wall biosynthesis